MAKQRNSKGQFVKGHRMSPGRKKGQPNKMTKLVQDMLTSKLPDAEAVIDDALRNKDSDIAKFIVQKCLPRDRLVSFTPPGELKTYDDCNNYLKVILSDCADGRITPREAGYLANIVEKAISNHLERELAEKIEENAAAIVALKKQRGNTTTRRPGR